ncbi:GyrI-like domain-containing protein [Arthrobacter sp. Helios]|uniref:GyrI-like domain-containing protein n=1 Tax=Arthrobacter sp. Helios TaxID=2828862 RepID=UPI002067F538|nr:GyrI-like domain-containing protein [Arthrobacter sp. Helios]UPO76848.1 GyrI-like domain-containing protein [Arthrobacter sp. Helios]
MAPPFSKYYWQPGAAVDVEADFPVASAIEPAGNVVPGHLPAGRIVEAAHFGTVDRLAKTYANIENFFAEHQLRPGEGICENYLADPETEQNPEDARTQTCWPVD